MIANVKNEIVDYKGQPIMDGESHLKMGDVLLNSANAGGKPEEDAGGKTRRYLLAMRIALAMNSEDGNISLTADEIVLLRDGVARLYFPLVLGRVMEALDPDSLK